jgi:hypothetical protein
MPRSFDTGWKESMIKVGTKKEFQMATKDEIDKMTHQEFNAYVDAQLKPKPQESKPAAYDPNIEYILLAPRLRVWQRHDRIVREIAQKRGIEPPPIELVPGAEFEALGKSEKQEAWARYDEALGQCGLRDVFPRLEDSDWLAVPQFEM